MSDESCEELLFEFILIQAFDGFQAKATVVFCEILGRLIILLWDEVSLLLMGQSC